MATQCSVLQRSGFVWLGVSCGHVALTMPNIGICSVFALYTACCERMIDVSGTRPQAFCEHAHNAGMCSTFPFYKTHSSRMLNQMHSQCCSCLLRTHGRNSIAIYSVVASVYTTLNPHPSPTIMSPKQPKDTSNDLPTRSLKTRQNTDEGGLCIETDLSRALHRGLLRRTIFGIAARAGSTLLQGKEPEAVLLQTLNRKPLDP